MLILKSTLQYKVPFVLLFRKATPKYYEHRQYTGAAAKGNSGIVHSQYHIERRSVHV